MAHALIVDDSASTLESLEQLVKLEGFTTSTAATMDQARAELAKQPPDVVLVDLNVPDGSGLSLFDSIGLSDTAPAVVLESVTLRGLRRGRVSMNDTAASMSGEPAIRIPGFFSFPTWTSSARR